MSTPPAGTPPLLPILLHTPSTPLLLPSTDCRAGVFEVTLPPQKRLCTAIGPRYKVGESSSAPTIRPTRDFRADYGFDKMLVDMPGAPATDDIELGRRMTEIATKVRHDTDEIYVWLDKAQDDRLLMSGRLNMLFKDRIDHDRTSRLMEIEAMMYQEAWSSTMDASDLTRTEVMALRTQVVAQRSEIAGLWAAEPT
ncbi:hypothetical protein Tco_0668250 [Tanacetum coccineum]